MYEHLPPDIQEEKQEAEEIRRYYKKGRVFPIIRSFSALRQRAPGELANRIFGSLLSIAACVVLLRNYDATGLGAVKVMFYFLAIIIASFWATGRLWRVIGLRARNAVRYCVHNMWTLYITGVTIAGVIVAVFFPHLMPEKPQPPPAAAKPKPPVELIYEEEAAHAREAPAPTVVRVYSGDGWKVLTTDGIVDYAPATIDDAHVQCRGQGTHWYLAEQKDFEIVGADLIAEDHEGGFWAGDRRGNSSLHYEIVEGEPRFVWALAAKDRTRNVLCVDRDALGGDVAIVEG